MSDLAAHSLGIVIVAFGHADRLAPTLDALAAQRTEGDFIVVVDNHPDGESARIAESHHAADLVLRSENVGFAGGSNLGAKSLPAAVDVVVLLNPDAVPQPDALMEMRRPEPEWAAWMGLLVLPEHTVNSGGNVVHISGLSWCGGFGDEIGSHDHRRLVTAASGACMAVRRHVWDELGGLAEPLFMYYEDTDLSMRVQLRGSKIGIVPTARFVHGYSFEKGPEKWFLLERNRYGFIVRTWPRRVVLLLLPVLVVTELVLWVTSVLQHRAGARTRAIVAVVRDLPRLWRERREIQVDRVIDDAAFFRLLTPRIDTPLMPRLARSRGSNMFFTAAYRVIERLLTDR